MIIEQTPDSTTGAKRRIKAVSPTEEEVNMLCSTYGIEREDLYDALDADELARVETLDNGRLLIARLPTFSGEKEAPHATAPYSLFLVNDVVISVSEWPFPFLEAPVRGAERERPSELYQLLLLLHKASFQYLKYLKDIQKRTDTIQQKLGKAILNKEVENMLAMEKSLVYFTTSLQSNILMIEKLRKIRVADWAWAEEEVDLYEDVLNETKQAIQLTQIHSTIISGMMDAFAGMIGININVMMKRLGALTLALTTPTVVAGFFAMNVGGTPFAGHAYGFWIVLAISVVTVGGVLIAAKKKKYL